MKEPAQSTGVCPKALSILEERNKAFRTLYDTVLSISMASEGEVSVILCRNLVKLSGAESGALASFNSQTKTITLEAATINNQDIIITGKESAQNTSVLTDEVINIYKHTPIRTCIDENYCMPNLLPSSVLAQIECSNEQQCVHFSCIREKELIAIGLLQFPPESKMCQKDMVDTYLSMAGMIIQRTNAIVALQRSHKKFQTLMEASPVGTMVTDHEHVIIDMNQSALELLGKFKSDVVGKKSSEFIVALPEGEQQGLTLDKQERQLITASGEQIPIMLSATPIEVDCQDLVLKTFVDLTERKNQEQEKLQLEKQLYQSQKLEGLGTLAAGIAHEINTPIQYIGDNVRFLEENVPVLFEGIDEYKKLLKGIIPKSKSEQINKTLSTIDERMDLEFIKEELPQAISQSREGLNRVSEIVQAMKAFSYLDDSKMLQADINKCVKSAIMVTKNEWKYIAAVNSELDPKLPEICCYVSDINQMLMNLIINATHAIEKTKTDTHDQHIGSITLSTRTVDSKNIEIKITDTGCGIPKEISHKIFEPFFTTKGVGKGTGQGLSMAYSIVTEKHKGTIKFESVPGQGTTFFITLPIVQETSC